MKVSPLDPPRVFRAGTTRPVELVDCARIELEPDEQVTFVTGSGAEYDVVRKSWGFYATPSLNGRLQSFGWRSALVRSASGRYFVMLVEAGRVPQFQRYLDETEQSVVGWLDDEATLADLERCLGGGDA